MCISTKLWYIAYNQKLWFKFDNGYDWFRGTWVICPYMVKNHKNGDICSLTLVSIIQSAWNLCRMCISIMSCWNVIIRHIDENARELCALENLKKCKKSSKMVYMISNFGKCHPISLRFIQNVYLYNVLVKFDNQAYLWKCHGVMCPWKPEKMQKNHKNGDIRSLTLVNVIQSASDLHRMCISIMSFWSLIISHINKTAMELCALENLKKSQKLQYLLSNYSKYFSILTKLKDSVYCHNVLIWVDNW